MLEICHPVPEFSPRALEAQTLNGTAAIRIGGSIGAGVVIGVDLPFYFV
jgi:hypothetical protein